MWRHYVYLHRRNDTGEPFYVGKGSLRPRHKVQVFERASARGSRSDWWRRIVNKHGFSVEIIASCQSDKAAQELEISMIAEIGRCDLGRGSLVNVTDGGDGHAGIIISDALRAKRSESAKGPRSQAWVVAIRKARKNGGNGGVVKRGDKLPAWWRKRISAGVMGASNPMYGRTGEMHPASRRVVNVETGEEYPSVSAAAVVLGMRMQTLHNMLTGFRKNWTTMRIA